MSVNGYFVTKKKKKKKEKIFLETLLCGYILHLIIKNILAWVFVMDWMLIHLLPLCDLTFLY